RLIRIVAFSDVLLDKRNRRLGIIIQRNARQRAGWVFGFLFEERNPAFAIERHGIVFLDLFEISHVVERENGSVFLTTELAKAFQLFAEQIVSRDNDQVIIHILRFQHVMDVANRAEFVGVISGIVVDDGEVEF